MKKFIRSLALMCVLAFGFPLFAACDGGSGGSGTTPTTPEEEGVPQGYYTLLSHTLGGQDVSGRYLYSYLQYDGETVRQVGVTLAGKTETSYPCTETETGLSVSIGVRTAAYAFDEAAKTLTVTGTQNRMPSTEIFAYNAQYTAPAAPAESGVAFTDELFGESLDENFYNYCPTVMTEGGDTMHIWYCSNEISGNVTDYVAYRKGTLQADGTWTFTEKELVLSPSASGWDSRHTCDPSVIKGSFTYGGTEYGYLMAYLGCSSSNNTDNEVGIAVANAPEGPWIKVGDEPVAKYIGSGEYVSGYWGYGQPSLVSVDGEGRVLLFYTKGLQSSTSVYVEYWDFSDLDNMQRLGGASVSQNGLANGYIFNNADFAYDAARGRLYCLAEAPCVSSDPSFITPAQILYYVDFGTEEEYPCATLFGGTYVWTKYGEVNEAATGYARNHNGAIVTDAYGRITDSMTVPVVYTVSILASQNTDDGRVGSWPTLHSYRLHGYVFEGVL